MSAIAERLRIMEHDSPLGRWRLALLQPHPLLAEAIELMWCVEGGNAYDVARILPRGNSHLIFNLGADQRVLDLHGVRDPMVYRHAWISGQQQRFLDIDSVGRSALIGVRFSALGAWQVLGVPQHELAGHVLDLDAVLGDNIHLLRQRLLEASSPLQLFTHFESWLLELSACRKPPHYAVRWAEQRMRDTHGCIEISELSADLGYCRKHLVSLFQREIGLSPKAFARVLRFSQALRRVRSSNQPQWDELALDCGYFDQSHLIREFQAYTGHSPGSFYRQPALDDESIHQQRGAE